MVHFCLSTVPMILDAWEKVAEAIGKSKNSQILAM